MRDRVGQRRSQSVKKLYLLLALAGLILPYYFLLSFLVENGLDIPLLFDQLFASDISTLFAADLILTAIAFLVFSYLEAARLHMRAWWVYLIATLAVGPSFALPMVLYFRAGIMAEEA
jgi:hypothetical protein